MARYTLRRSRRTGGKTIETTAQGTRYSGDLVVTMRVNDRKSHAYQTTVRCNPKAKHCKCAPFHGEIGMGPGWHGSIAEDSKRAYDMIGKSAISFAMNDRPCFENAYVDFGDNDYKVSTVNPYRRPRRG